MKYYDPKVTPSKKTLKKVYWERQEKSEYWEFNTVTGWQPFDTDKGDAVFTVTRWDHQFIRIVASDEQYMDSKYGMIMG